MNFFIALVALALVCMQQSIAASTNILNFKPNGDITRFESTLVIPPTSNADAKSAVQQIWPAVGPSDDSALLMNSVTNSYGTGTWELWPLYLPQNSGIGAAPRFSIYPGQALTSIFAKDITNGQWLNAWVVESGGAPNVQSYAGSLQMDPAKSTVNKPYQTALLALEFQGSATWTYGPVSWMNIIIVAKTQDTNWCTKPTASWRNLTWSTPVATRDGDYTTCYINSITMFGP